MSMIIKVDKLKNIEGSVHPFHFHLNKSDLEGKSDLPLGSGVLSVEGNAENKARIITITAKISCSLTDHCDRCGVPVEVKVETDFKESFSNLAEKTHDDAADEEADIHFFEGDEIDLLPYAEQAIFLATPMKILCKEDCRGLCPQCGTNLNEKECSCDKSPIDPRFAVLADLLNKG